MIENYLHTSKKLQAVFLLIDIRHEPSDNDIMTVSYTHLDVYKRQEYGLIDSVITNR